MKKRVPDPKCILKEIIPNVSVLPSNVNLAAAEIELIGIERKEYILKNEVDYIKEDAPHHFLGKDDSRVKTSVCAT